ncbi:XAA-PRO aminopeptidase 1, partial [Elysia marginata]
MNKGGILSKLRALMHNAAHVSQPVNAYIIPSGDMHQSEYVAECDLRRAYISGFTGSDGTAIVTDTEAALWTDGRYFLQAEQQLSGDWTLMKAGLPDTPSDAKWLSNVLPTGGRVGCDPALLSMEKWKPLSKELKSNGHELVGVNENLVDLLWSDRPDRPCSDLIILSEKETGAAWQKKVSNIRGKMTEEKTSAVVLTALDEIAWLFNMRGSDICYNPVFFAFTVITKDKVNLFIDPKKLTNQVQQHLSGVTFHPYDTVYKFIANLAGDEAVSKIWISSKSSYAIFSQVPKVKDAVALCEFFVWLEKAVPTGTVTEITASDKAEFFRSQQENFMSLSFDTISSIGADAAIIHYKPKPETDKEVTTEEIYLIDSGAQYREGTTDTTRTIHLGTPSQHEQECFTRVLKGHINLSTAIFPKGLKGHMLDSLARQSLWEIGLDYRHGTGHGVGAFLNVHEGPCGISFRVSPSEIGLEENMIVTDEPGYYEDGKFGIRIENCVKVVKAETKHRFGGKDYLTFEPITVVPLQKKMIDATMLTEKE